MLDMLSHTFDVQSHRALPYILCARFVPSRRGVPLTCRRVRPMCRRIQTSNFLVFRLWKVFSYNILLLGVCFGILEKRIIKIVVPTQQSFTMFFVDGYNLVFFRKIMLYGIYNIFRFFLCQIFALNPRIKRVYIDTGNLRKGFITDICAS